MISHFNIQDFGPKEISSKDNNIWVVLDDITKNANIYINNIALASCVDIENCVITTTVPEFVFNLDLDYVFYVWDSSINSKSKEFIIKINKNEPKLSNNIEYLKKENFKLNMKLYKNSYTQLPLFEGWGMSTNHKNPWDDKYLWSTLRKSLEELKSEFSFGLEDSIGINQDNVSILNWRHYIVAFCTSYSLKFSKDDKYVFVECGVGDGMSAFISLSEIKNYTNSFSYHLYDTWVQIDNSSLDKSESFLENHYDNLDINRTKNNLSKFDNFCIYHKGFIPKIFNDEEKLEKINYLHIDLNSINATISALNEFLPKMQPGAIILFDDYGWHGYESTKEAIDKYFSETNGMLLKLPTGQAIYLCN